MTTLRDIGEDALIDRLVRLVPLAPGQAGPGDDCAVVASGNPGMLQLLKTDALVENIHFLPDTPARQVGWKAIARVISDFAAMGGTPGHFLVTLALPPDLEIAWVEELYRGMGECLRTCDATLAGGETSSVPAGSAIVISIAATGTVEPSHLTLRSTARPGDAILVTGALGGSLAGKHLTFTPRLREAAWLVRHFRPTSMMDLSDGLAKDLPRLAKASNAGFFLDPEKIPRSPGSTLQQALGDGEDFELLFTLAEESVPQLLTAWTTEFSDVPLSVIGKITAPGEGQTLQGGWEHFA
ncbi:MAG: thiamine-phosphate kinase [Luteolibacter sp.]